MVVPRRRSACVMRCSSVMMTTLLPLEREFHVARPFVPRTCVVARVVAGAAQRKRGERRARAGMAVGDDVLRVADERADLLRRLRQQVRAEQLVALQPARAGDVALPRVAGAPRLAVVLLLAADVE